MTVTTVNLIMGPADLYVAVYGTTEPADSAVTPNPVPPPSAWLNVGATNGGINFEVDNTYTKFEVDQWTMSPGARLTEQAMSVTAKLAEVTLGNINAALNQICLISQGNGYATMDIPIGSVTTQPKYAALLVDGWAPTLQSGYPARRRIIVRKVLAQTKVGLMADKKTQQGIDCTWEAYGISDSITPVHVVEQQA